MNQQNILAIYKSIPKVDAIVHQFKNQSTSFKISNTIGSSLSFIISSVFEKLEKPLLLIFDDKEEAAYYLNDLEQLVGGENVLFYPSSYKRPYQIEEVDNANVLLRSEVLNKISENKNPIIIVTYPDALFEKVITKKNFKKHTKH